MIIFDEDYQELGQADIDVDVEDNGVEDRLTALEDLMNKIASFLYGLRSSR